MKGFTVRGVRILSSVLISAMLLALSLACFLPESVTIVGGESYAPIYCGSRDNNAVSLMFNVYEDAETVNGIIDVLNDYGAKSTFFVGGCFADDNEETLKRIVACGHELGNHGYFHLNHKKLSEQKNCEEIENNHKVVRALCGTEMTLFAPPSGAYSTVTLKCAERLGYKTIMWSKDTIDWRDKDAELVFKRATENVENGDLILMHPKKHTLSALGRVLDYYKERNIRAVTVSECINSDDI